MVDTQAPELSIDCPADVTFENECYLGGCSNDVCMMLTINSDR